MLFTEVPHCEVFSKPYSHLFLTQTSDLVPTKYILNTWLGQVNDTYNEIQKGTKLCPLWKMKNWKYFIPRWKYAGLILGEHYLQHSNLIYVSYM